MLCSMSQSHYVSMCVMMSRAVLNTSNSSVLSSRIMYACLWPFIKCFLRTAERYMLSKISKT